MHTYICYLAGLPFNEQLYWQSFNEWPKGNISKRAYQTDILGEFSTEDDPLAELKGQVQSLDRDPPVWWRPRGEALVEEALYPATDSIEEWGNEILALDQLVVEGFLVKRTQVTLSVLLEVNTRRNGGHCSYLRSCFPLRGTPEDQGQKIGRSAKRTPRSSKSGQSPRRHSAGSRRRLQWREKHTVPFVSIFKT